MATSTRALPGDDDKGPAILGAITTTTVLAIIFVVTRLYARIRVVRAVGPDDYFVVAALVKFSNSRIFSHTDCNK